MLLESFDENLLNYTRLSLSTKIPEYLSSGKPIFAAGHSEQGSIKYLNEYNAAYVTTDKNNIESAFIDFIEENEIEKKLYTAKKLFLQNHEIKKQQELFLSLLNLTIKP